MSEHGPPSGPFFFWTCSSRTCIFRVALRFSSIQMSLLFSEAWSRCLFSFGPDRQTLLKMIGLGRQRPPIDCRLDAVLPPSANPLHVIGAPVTVVQPTQEAWRDRFRRCPPHLISSTAIVSNCEASCWISSCDSNNTSTTFDFQWPRKCGTISRNLRKPHSLAWLGCIDAGVGSWAGRLRPHLSPACRPETAVGISTVQQIRLDAREEGSIDDGQLSR